MKRTGSAGSLRKRASVCAACLLLLALCACAETGAGAPAGETDAAASENTAAAGSAGNAETQADARTMTEGDAQMETGLRLEINGEKVSAVWEDNDSVAALRELAVASPVTIRMSMYGGFEQVGSIGTDLPRNDVQTTAGAGDIVLYSGSRLVIFYSSNSWAYTRLGRITDRTGEELAALLGSGDVTVTLRMEKGG